eukprot:gene35372-45816_t
MSSTTERMVEEDWRSLCLLVRYNAPLPLHLGKKVKPATQREEVQQAADIPRWSKDRPVLLLGDVSGSMCKIALTVWNTDTMFARGTYLDSSDEAFVKSWLDGLTCDKAYNVDVFVMCDGDIDPFDISSWKAFTQQFVDKGIRIHTVAFAEDSDHDQMQVMARICGGMFTSTNKDN